MRQQRLKVLVNGGGIGGLSFAAFARHLPGVDVTILERSTDLTRANAGGGIGLWPNSVNSLDLLPGATEELSKVGLWMPSPRYTDRDGRTLGEPSEEFNHHFPILCIKRDDLLRVLYEKCVDDSAPSEPVEIVSGSSMVDFEVPDNEEEQVRVELSDGSFRSCDVLIGADGINSMVRRQLLSRLGHRPVEPHHMGYTYFRATPSIDLPSDAGQGFHDYSFEAWGDGMRFGYVPLKPPDTFYFCAIKTDDRNLPPMKGVHVVTEETRQWLLSIFGLWKGDINFASLLDRPHQIIRSDIYKIPDVTGFPWQGYGGRVVLLGDSAHATAPNVAQGAGLSIEDAATLANELYAARPYHTWRRGLQQAAENYERERKPRAWMVQTFADTIARVGQLDGKLVESLRNQSMHYATRIFPSIEHAIFERAVSVSLGGDGTSRRTWLPPAALPTPTAYTALERRSLLGRILPKDQLDLLPRHVREFKCSPLGGRGTGTVTVERGNSALARLIGSMFGLPPEMSDARFDASVTTLSGGRRQKWTRVFGVGIPDKQTSFSTTHSVGSLRLLEGVGGWLDRLIQFGYRVAVSDTTLSLSFESLGLWIKGWRLPFPSALLPKSRWKEIPTEKGWTFDGTISMPWPAGMLMHYYGNFEVNNNNNNSQDDEPRRRAIVAGGTGMLGDQICRSLKRRGFEVVVLTRQRRATSSSEADAWVDRYVHWDGTADTSHQWEGLIDRNTVVINLAGENPGASRWTDKTRAKILDSQLEAIAACKRAIHLAAERGESACAFIQASAAGVVGDRPGETLTDDCTLPTDLPRARDAKGSEFRAACCIELEAAAREGLQDNNHNDNEHNTAVCLMRIGHVLAQEGGLLPYLELASTMRASRLGPGDQAVPWIHVNDVAEAFTHVASHPGQYEGSVNVVAPHSTTNAELFAQLAAVRKRALCMLPVPAWALRAAVGDSACILLDSQRLVPERLMQGGFRFQYPDISDALHACQ